MKELEPNQIAVIREKQAHPELTDIQSKGKSIMKPTGLDKFKAMIASKKMPSMKANDEVPEGEPAKMDSPEEEMVESPKAPAKKKGIRSIADLRAAALAKKL